MTVEPGEAVLSNEEELDAIRADIGAIVARLDELIGDSDGS